MPVAQGSVTPLSDDDHANLNRCQYIQVAAVAILVYDFTLTLTDEIYLIWSRKQSLYTAMFYLVRYLSFIDAAVFLLAAFVPLHPTRCLQIYNAQSWLYFFSVFLAAGTLIFRTYAIWKSDARIAWLLSALLLVFTGISAYFLAHANHDINLVPIPEPDRILFPGCFVAYGHQTIWIAYLFLLSYETIILALTLFKVVYELRRQQVTPFKIIFRDGLSFYVLLSAASVINVVFFIAVPDVLKASFVTLHMVLHAVLSGRMILNIRGSLAVQRDEE